VRLILFILGLLIGSFLNVLGLRWRSGKGFGGRSFCVACYKPLRWYELVPVISFASQGGKCRGCKSKVSWQYPLIELLTAAVFSSVFDPSQSILANLLRLAFFSMLIVITIYDARHKIIPDELAYAAILSGLVYRLLVGGTLLDWLSPLIVFSFFALIWLATHGRAMGFGDAKLGLAIALFLGAKIGFSAIVLAFWIGAVAAVGYMLVGKTSLLKPKIGLTMKSEIPFAPFMVIGAWISLVLSLNILHVAL
jgi:prepilin signal peptidase PulO-like enzyme (type II secretory pathway)